MMSVRALLSDELVPSQTAVVEGVVNRTVPAGEHVVSIGAALTVFSGRGLNLIYLRG